MRPRPEEHPSLCRSVRRRYGIRCEAVHALAAALTIALMIAGCSPMATIRGDRSTPEGWPIPGIVDPQGIPLPGVSISVSGMDSQAISDVNGQYRLRARPGLLQLHFIKTGYTPATLQLQLDEARGVDAAQVVMWPLPDSKGVYLYENFRYVAMTRTEPAYCLIKEDDKTAPISRLAARIAPEAVTHLDRPLIIAHKVPTYDLHCHRLRAVKAADAPLPGAPAPKAEAFSLEVWLPAERIGIVARAIDDPGRLLMELQPDGPFAPGVYAIHWGTFDGYTSIEASVYLFEVRPAVMEVEAPEAIEPEETPAVRSAPARLPDAPPGAPED